MSAASLATSTAESTDRPTSAECKRRRIVDAVAQIPDDMTAGFEREDHPIFLRWVDPTKQIGLFPP